MPSTTRPTSSRNSRRRAVALECDPAGKRIGSVHGRSHMGYSGMTKETFADACRLWSEDKPQHCHQRLVAAHLKEKWSDIDHCTTASVRSRSRGAALARPVSIISEIGVSKADMRCIAPKRCWSFALNDERLRAAEVRERARGASTGAFPSRLSHVARGNREWGGWHPLARRRNRHAPASSSSEIRKGAGRC